MSRLIQNRGFFIINMAISPKKQASHPSYADMISKAIVALKERSGSSVPAIVKFIQSNFKDTEIIHIKTQLKRLAVQGKLVRSKNSYKLSSDLKLALKKSSSAKSTSSVKAVKKVAKSVKTAKKAKKAPKKSAGKKKTPTKKPAKKNANALASVPAPKVATLKGKKPVLPHTPSKTPEKKVKTPVKGSAKKVSPKKASARSTPKKTPSKSPKKSPKSSGKKSNKSSVRKNSKAITRVRKS